MAIDKPEAVPFFIVAALFLAVIMAMPLAVFSQYDDYYYYYGKNKVQKGFDWQHVETPHFKIFYYTTDEKLIRKVSGAA